MPLAADVKANLLAQLIEPFGDEVAAEEFWQPTNTALLLIEPEDSLQHFAEYQELINFAFEYPEHVMLLNDDGTWLLALAITSSDGGGIYLCAPKCNAEIPFAELAAQIV